MQAARGASLTSDARPLKDRSRQGLVLGIAVAAWLVDLGTKILAQHHLSGHGPENFLGSFLRLDLTHNAGAAFSTGTGITPVISIFALVALVVVAWFARRTATVVWAWGMGLLLAGIAGNLTDRIFRDPGPLRGHVVDFLELPHWPIFNVADMCINVAAALIVIQSVRGVPLAGRPAEAAPGEGSQ